MRIVAALALLAVVAGCGADAPLPERTLVPSEANGVRVSAVVRAAERGFVVEAEVENHRDDALVLQPDGCGDALTAVLKRGKERPQGRGWPSRSVTRLKGFVLQSQADEDHHEQAALEADGPCEPRSHPVTLAPGTRLHRRWTVTGSALLDALGARQAKLSVSVTEPGRAFPTGSAEGSLGGVVDWPARRARMSPAEEFDRLLEEPRLYRLLDAEPPDSWEGATLAVDGSHVTLTARSRLYDRPFVATTDAGRVTISAPSRGESPGLVTT
jgi:hypothetical protein